MKKVLFGFIALTFFLIAFSQNENVSAQEIADEFDYSIETSENELDNTPDEYYLIATDTSNGAVAWRVFLGDDEDINKPDKDSLSYDSVSNRLYTYANVSDDLVVFEIDGVDGTVLDTLDNVNGIENDPMSFNHIYFDTDGFLYYQVRDSSKPDSETPYIGKYDLSTNSNVATFDFDSNLIDTQSSEFMDVGDYIAIHNQGETDGTTNPMNIYLIDKVDGTIHDTHEYSTDTDKPYLDFEYYDSNNNRLIVNDKSTTNVDLSDDAWISFNLSDWTEAWNVSWTDFGLSSSYSEGRLLFTSEYAISITENQVIQGYDWSQFNTSITADWSVDIGNIYSDKDNIAKYAIDDRVFIRGSNTYEDDFRLLGTDIYEIDYTTETYNTVYNQPYRNFIDLPQYISSDNFDYTPHYFVTYMLNYDTTTNTADDFYANYVVEEGSNSPVPTIDPTLDGETFVQWSHDGTNITSDTRIEPVTDTSTYTVTFEDYDGTVLRDETVEHGDDATPPDDPTRDYLVFDGWDGTYTNVQQDETVTATYDYDRTGHINSDVAWVDDDGTTYTYNDIFDETQLHLEDFYVQDGNTGIDFYESSTDEYTIEVVDQNETDWIRIWYDHSAPNPQDGNYYFSLKPIAMNYPSDNLRIGLFDGGATNWDTLTGNLPLENERNSFIKDVSSGDFDKTSISADIDLGDDLNGQSLVLEDSIYNVYMGVFGTEPTKQDMNEMLAVYENNFYTVIFEDYDGTVLKEETVEHGSDASPPSDPTRTGYTFAGWSGTYTDVQQDETVTATYDIIEYTVTFEDYDGTVLKEETVEHGSDATPPADPTREGYDFTGWSGDYTDVTRDETITAVYDTSIYTVTFEDYDGTVLRDETVEHGDDATPPDDPTREGYIFDGWDGTYTNVQQDETVTATYIASTYTVTFIDVDRSILKQETVDYQSDATPPTEPSHEHFTFDAWEGDYTNVTRDTTVKASYETDDIVGSFHLFLYRSGIQDGFALAFILVAIMIGITIFMHVMNAPYVGTIMVNALVFILGVVFAIIPIWILLALFVVVMAYIVLIMYDFSPSQGGK